MSAHPKRPDHPDFWLMSRIVIAHDKASEAGVAMDDIMGRYADPASASYMAVQRAMRVKQLFPAALAPMPVLAAIWLDAFAAGVEFQSGKQWESQ